MVMFAYSGWNCASYIAGEIKNPEKNLHRALFTGTFIVMIIYLLLNVVYLMSTDGSNLMGKDEVGAIATSSLFGPENKRNIYTRNCADTPFRNFSADDGWPESLLRNGKRQNDISVTCKN